MKFDNSVGKGLKLKVEKFWRLIPTFAEVTEKNLVGVGPFSPPSLILNRIKGMNPVILKLSGCPRIGLINESNIDILQKNQYDVVAENVCKGALVYSLLIYQIS